MSSAADPFAPPRAIVTSYETITRNPQWIYLVPVMGAPLAHIFVSAISKYPHLKRPLAAAVALSTVTMVGNRLFLMHHAGYPGGEGDKTDDRFH